jgi:uncharacterized GH25 family protein
MVRVHVVYNGRGVSGAYVHISWRGGGHSSGRTDSNGYINFNVSSGEGTISVEGKEVFKGVIKDVIEVPRIY